jgi:4-azaleucine resistance transporter AzlC
MTVEASRRRLIADGLGIVVTAIGFGVVYGLSAREAGLSFLETAAMSSIVFAGAAQFAAIGALTQGVGWPAIVLLTAFLNARHLLYSAAVAPWFSGTPRSLRAIVAHLLTDEAFALSIAHFRRIGGVDLPGYWYAAIVVTFIPWNLSTAAGHLLGGAVSDPSALGIDVIFPAAMAGLALGLATGRREVVAAGAGAAIAVVVSLAWDPSGGVVVGGLLGPLVGLLVPGRDELPVSPVPLGAPWADAEAEMRAGGGSGRGAEAGTGVGAPPVEADPGRDPDIGVAP